MVERITDQQELTIGRLATNLLRGVITAAVYTQDLPTLPRQSIRDLLNKKGILRIIPTSSRKEPNLDG